MKIAFQFTALSLMLFLLPYSMTKAQNETFSINEELTYRQLSEQTYLITHYLPWGGNSLFVLVGTNSAVLIDTPYDGVGTKALLDWIYGKFGMLEISAIVTGFHQDNLGGNEVLLENDIPVYGMKLTAELVKTLSDGLKDTILVSVKSNENPMYLERYKKLMLVQPDKVFDLKFGESKVLEIDGEKFDFYFPGESHTIDNTVVYIPNQKILFGGCMIRALRDQQPGYTGYANMQEWPVSAGKVLKKFPEAAIVVPGHGNPGDISLIKHTIEILNQWNINHP